MSGARQHTRSGTSDGSCATGDKKEHDRQSAHRVESRLERTQIDGVPTLRLSVWTAESQAPPRSFAVEAGSWETTSDLFGGDTTAELLVRWYETGIFYPFFRNHSRKGSRSQEPYAFGDVAEENVRTLIETRYRLLPYIQSLFWEHMRTGAPLMRPLLWHYGDDDVAAEIDDQFLFGPDILVAPILERARTRRSVYLPQGRWCRFDGPEVLDGGRDHVVEMPLGTVPAFVREGAIVPLADVVQNTEHYGVTPITFTAYGERSAGIFFEDDGKSCGYQRGEYNEWKLQFVDGVLNSTIIHRGYNAPPRAFFLEVDGRRSAVELS